MLLGGNMGMTDLQGKSAASKSNAAAVATIVSVANRTNISGRQQLERKFDPEYQKRLLKLQNMRFQSKADLMKRFPYKNELVLKKVVYTWHDLVVLSQDQVNDVLEQEWIGLPSSIGRIRMNSYLKQRYIGISSPAIINFLAHNDLHQQYRQRRRSQRTKTTISSAPFKNLMIDLTDIPRVGRYRYLMCVIDLFSKHAWVAPLAKKSGAVCGRELQKIFNSLPPGAHVSNLKSDLGLEFRNPAIKAVLDRTSTTQSFGLPGNPLGQGSIEVFNRIIKSYLFSDLIGDKSIGSFVPALQRVTNIYNNTISRATGYVPATLNDPALPPHVISDVLAKLQRNAKGTQSNLRYQPQLKPGDKIRIAVEQLDNEIMQQIKSGSYKPSHHATYSKRVYTVRLQDENNFVRIEENRDFYPRGACLLIPSKDE
jgi:transposase InsO family protein